MSDVNLCGVNFLEMSISQADLNNFSQTLMRIGFMEIPLSLCDFLNHSIKLNTD